MEPYRRGQWDTALRATPQSPGVMIRVIDACEQPARSGAHGFRSHRPGSLLTLRKFCRIRAISFNVAFLLFQPRELKSPQECWRHCVSGTDFAMPYFMGARRES
jgi:hypothetical protein